MLNFIPMSYADIDVVEARRLQASGEILPLQSILKEIRQILPGKIIEAELEKKANDIVYEIEILTNEGIVKEVYLDAKTGRLLSIEDDH